MVNLYYTIIFHLPQPYSPPVINELRQHTTYYAKRSTKITHKRFLKDIASLEKDIKTGKTNDQFGQDIDKYYRKAVGKSHEKHT
jgi:uncharacterized protein YaaW (UPF0174 family)